MVHNGYEYLSEFITHHLLLCDHLYIIDHNSQRDLRQLDIDRVTFLRTSHEAQFQSECTNLVIEHFGIKKKFDWLFVLDIDEFLPFKNKNDFQAFLTNHSKDSTLEFNWRNGVPFYDAAEQPQSLIDCNSIRFFHKNSPHVKTAVNIRKTKGRFVVPTGAHHIHYPPPPKIKLPFTYRKERYISPVSETPLNHVVAFNKDAFVKKIKIYVEQMKYREHIKGQGGWMVRNYPDTLSDDDWLWYIANFRVSDETQFQECRNDLFIEDHIFSHLDKNAIHALHAKILSMHTTPKGAADEDEKEYLSFKSDDRHVMQNIKWFSITAGHEIVTSVPAHWQRKAAA